MCQYTCQFRTSLSEHRGCLAGSADAVTVFDEERDCSRQGGDQQSDGIHLRDEVEGSCGSLGNVCCDGMCLGGYRSSIDVCGICCYGQTTGKYGCFVFHHELRCSGKQFHQHGESCAGVFNNRQQLTTQFHGHLMELLLTFVQVSLNGVVHHTELLHHAVAFLVCFGSQSLTLADIVDLVCHSGEHTDCTGTVQSHVIEHLHHRLRILTAQTVGQIEDCLVGILIQEPCELLHFHAGDTCKLLRVRLHLR